MNLKIISAWNTVQRTLTPLLSRLNAFGIHVPIALSLFILLNIKNTFHPDWLPVHDTLNQMTVFLYSLSAYQTGEIPLWNSYLHGGQPFYLMLNQYLLLNPILWIWMALGSLLELSPVDIFVYCRLTEIVFFAAGGYFLAKEIFGDRVVALAAFIILLFSGDACYWPNQIWGFSVAEYAPWIVYSALRYFKRQTFPNAIVFSAFLGISMNFYIPMFLSVFLSTLLILIFVFHFPLLKKIDYRKFLIHLPAALGIILAFSLPLYLNIHEITDSYYQMGRFKGPEEQIKYDPSGKGVLVSRGDFRRIWPGMHSVQRGYVESVPLVGLPAFVFMILGIGSFSRSSRLWTVLFLLLALNYVGWTAPYHFLCFYLLPGYRYIRSFGFFSGFISLVAAILACIGVHNLLRIYPSFLTSQDAAQTQVNRFKHLLLACFTAAGAYNLYLTSKLPYHNVRASLFSFNPKFNFAFVRPDKYSEAHLPKMPVVPYENLECCSATFHTAEKLDGPGHFYKWGSPHTPLVNKTYYHVSEREGFDGLIKEKLHFLRYYAVVKDPMLINNDISTLLKNSTLVLEDETALRLLKHKSKRMGGKEEKAVAPKSLGLIKKTANEVAFEIEMDEDIFLLYTDLYHEGFVATIDKIKTPVLKGMGAFKAIELPKGRHIVEFKFRPINGIALSVYLILAVGFLLVFCLGGMIAGVSKAFKSQNPPPKIDP